MLLASQEIQLKTYNDMRSRLHFKYSCKYQPELTQIPVSQIC